MIHFVKIKHGAKLSWLTHSEHVPMVLNPHHHQHHDIFANLHTYFRKIVACRFAIQTTLKPANATFVTPEFNY